MTANGKTFNASVAKWRKELGGQMLALAREAVNETAYTVVITTPVDTGFLRGSWQPSIGKPNTEALEGKNPVALSGVISSIKLGDTFFMVNGAVYGPRIEFGFVGADSLGRYYNQRGRFFVTAAVKAWPETVSRIAARIVRHGPKGPTS